MRPPNYPMMQLKMWLHWVFAERRCHRLPALLTLASKAGSRTVMAGPEQSTMGRWWRRGRPHFPPEHAFVWSSFSEKCPPAANFSAPPGRRSEEHTSELQSLMRISYAVFCLKKNKECAFVSSSSRHIDEHNTKITHT